MSTSRSSRGQESEPSSDKPPASVAENQAAEEPSAEPSVEVPPEKGESDSTRRLQPGWFHLHSLEGYLELDAALEQSRVRTKDRGGWIGFGPTQRWHQKNRDIRLEETLNLRLDADVVDPAFLELQGELGLGLTQGWFKEERPGKDFTDRDHGDLQTYDLHLNILKEKPISGSVYGTRTIDRIPRRFLPSLRKEIDSYGTSWATKSVTFPMRLTYDHRETDRTGNLDDLDDEHLEEETLRWEGDWLISEDHSLRLAYEHGRLQQDYQGSPVDFDTRHDELSADHQLRFGGEKQHTLDTHLRYRAEQGDLARDLFDFGPQLTLQHTPELSTRYTYQYYQEKFDNLTVDTHRADFQLVHQLYTNLTSTYNVFGLHEKTEDDIQEDQWGAGADYQYNRKNRWGHFRGHLSYQFDSAVFNGDDGLRLITNESGAFRDPLPITLSQRSVVPGSVIVMDTKRQTVYLPLQDYMLRESGDRTLITRAPTGRLADGDTVLVQYLYRTPTDGQIDTHRFDFGLSQEFLPIGLTPYYDLQFRKQEVDYSTGLPADDDRLERHRIGLRYRKDRWSASAEYEIYQDTIDPYTAYHLNGSVDLLRKADHSLDLTTEFSRFFFDGEENQRNVNFFDGGLNHRLTIDPRTAWHTTTSVRWEDDSVDGMTHGVDVESGLEYRIGQLTVDLSAEYDLLNVEEDKQDGFGVWLRVRRDFGDLLARR